MKIWFGASWLAGGDVRRTLALGRPHAEALTERIFRLERLAIASGVLTLLTGLGLAWSIYHRSSVPGRLYVVLALTLGTMAVGAFLVGPSWRRVAAVIENGNDLRMAANPATRFAHALWLERGLQLAILAIIVGKDVGV